MNTVTVAIADTHPPERNVRLHPENQVRELARAVEMFGQTRPIVLDETNTVLVGNGLVEAFKLLGRTHIDALQVLDLSPSMKSKLMLADNKLYDLGHDDYEAIMATLRGLEDSDIPGFDPEVVRQLTATTADLERVTVGGYGAMSPEAQQQTAARTVPPGSTDPGASAPAAAAPAGAGEIVCPQCGHRIPRPAAA